MKKIIVVGGGAAGMMAAVFASESGADVTVIERGDRLGKKLLITGTAVILLMRGMKNWRMPFLKE